MVGLDFDTACLLSSDWELDVLAGLDPGFDEDVDGEEDHGGEDETEQEVEAEVSDLTTDGLDTHLSGCGRVLEYSDIRILAVSIDLAPFGGGVDPES